MLKDKTKEQLITELTVARQRISELEKTTQEYYQLVDLFRERIKELSCIYAVTQIIDAPEIALDEIYQQVVDILPNGWKYPKIARARIVIGEKEFKTRGYKETKWKLSSDIEVNGTKDGILDVCYLSQQAEMDEFPFLDEEWLLISIIAGRLGRITELIHARH
jgi:hypothetical protein